MSGETVIRALADEGDVLACARLMASSEPWLSLGRTVEEATSVLTSPGREVYVAEIDSEVVGFVILVLHGLFVGIIQSIAVQQDMRGRGIGAALMEFSETRIFKDFPNVFLVVSSENEGAIRFYKRLGYEAVGELRDLLIRGETEILMRKTTGPIAELAEEKRRRAQSS